MFKQAMKSFGWNFIGSGLGFIFQLFAARFLGAEEFGKANFYLGFSATISIFTFFGVQFFLPKYISTSLKKKELFQNFFWTLSVIFLTVIPVIMLSLTRFITIKYIIVVIIITYLTVILEVVFSYLIGLSKAEKASFYKNFLFKVTNIVTFFLFILLLGRSHNGYLYALILSYLLIVLPFLLKNINSFSLDFSLIKISWQFYIIQILYGLFTSLSRVLQGEFGSFENVAVLSIGLLLSNIISLLGNNITNVLMPNFAKSWQQNDFQSIQYNYKKYTRINAYFILPIVIFIIVNSEKVLFLLGKGYQGGGLILSFLLFGQFINSFVGPNGTVLLMTGHERFEVFNGIVKLISALVFGFFLGPTYFWGIALALAISEIIVNLFKMIELGVVLKIWPYRFIDFLYILGLSLIEIISFHFISRINCNIIILLIVGFVYGSLICVLSFMLSPNHEDKHTIKQIISYIKKVAGKVSI